MISSQTEAAVKLFTSKCEEKCAAALATAAAAAVATTSLTR